MSARNLKLRAIENGVYDKFHLTRTRFEIPPDLLTTDMGNSYLALRTVLKDSITRADVDTRQNPNEVPVFFCLGDGATAYDGTSLFRTAKLFNKATGAVIEELNSNNIRTNTFKEYCTDFDNLASDTIETGLGIPDANLANLQSTYTLWTNATNNTVELHIPLKSLFPSLNTPFYQLSAVGGLLIDLEWDTSHPLVMSYTNPALIIPPPPILASGLVGFNTVAQENYSWLVLEQVNSQFAPIEKPFAVPTPYGWEFPRVDADVAGSVRYWESLTGEVYGAPDGSGNYTGITDYEWHGERQTYTQQDLIDLTLNPTTVAPNPTFMADVQVALLKAGSESPFVFADSIVGPDGKKLKFLSTHQPCKENTLGVLGARFDGLVAPCATPDKTGVDPVSLYTSLDEARFLSLKNTRTVVIDAPTEAALVKAGILTDLSNNVVFANTGTTFNVHLQMIDGSANIYMCPDFDLDVDTIQTTVTNQKYQCPVEDIKRLNVELYVPATKTITFSADLNLKYVASQQNAHNFLVIYDDVDGNDPKALRKPKECLLFFQDVQYERPFLKSLPHYPSCDLAEMVLVQYPPTKTPMPKFYRTMSVEPFVIPAGMTEHVQNFMLQPNTYNAWILIPYRSENTDVSTSPSLICGDGQVLKFRATIDEVDVVNKDIQLGAFPDSLYWDKLADCFSNSAMPMKTLTGTVSGYTQRPVRVFPVRIYGGLVNGVVSFSNFMKRLQIRLNATQGETVQSGTAYLFKEMYKAY